MNIINERTHNTQVLQRLKFSSKSDEMTPRSFNMLSRLFTRRMTVFQGIKRQPLVHRIYYSRHSAITNVRSRHHNQQLPQPAIPLAMAGLLGLLWGKREEEEGEGEGEEEGGVPLSVKKSIYKAERSMENIDYVEAERHFHEALYQVDASEHATAQPFVEAKAVILDKMGNMYLQCGEWQKAVSSLVVVISLMRISGKEEESPPIVELSLKIAKAYANMKRFDRARLGFEWCIATARSIHDRDGTSESYALLGMCYHCKGQFHLLAKEPGNAHECYSLAVECTHSVYGGKHVQVAVMMNDKAAALDAMGEFEKAEEAVCEAVDIIEGSDEERDENYDENMAVFLMNLAAIQCNQGQPDRALETYRSSYKYALKLSNRTLSKDINKKINSLQK